MVPMMYIEFKARFTLNAAVSPIPACCRKDVAYPPMTLPQKYWIPHTAQSLRLFSFYRMWGENFDTHNFGSSPVATPEAVNEAGASDLGFLHLVGVYHEGNSFI